MHLPDGFLDGKTVLLTTAAAAVGVGLAVRHVKSSLEPRQTPMLGLASAFLFAAQMLNFPIAGGTSGHLMGGVLAAVLLGPAAAIVVLTCVLLVQSLVFADGGITALGANVFNIAIVSVCGGYGVYLALKRWIPVGGTRGIVFAAAFSAWAGTVFASVSCAGQLALSKTVAWSVALPAMVNIHMLIGLGEAVATGLITAAVLRSRPSLVWVSNAPEPAPSMLLAYGLLLCLGLAVFVAPFASPWPDGLESVAQSLGFANRAAEPVVSSPMTDYELPGIRSPIMATSMAGLIGTLVAFATAYLLARSLVPNLPNSKHDVTSES